MPRRAREKCEYSTYHTMIRGNNRQNIFVDEEDRLQYLKILKRYKEQYKAEVYAYCLMTNHVHLLIYDNGQDISKIMKGLNQTYVRYFNKKYNRCGHLFQDRFTSVMVKRDNYFVEVSKYIHLNPTEAGIVESPENYKWSSLRIYLGENDFYQIIDSSHILSYFSKNYKRSIKLYTQYMYDREVEKEVAAAIESGHKGIGTREVLKKISEEQIMTEVCKYFNVNRLELVRRDNKVHHVQRDLAIYVMVLRGRMPYKKVGEMFYVKPAAIGESIRRAINLMLENPEILEEINSLLKQIS